MPTPIVVLSEDHRASQEAVAYAALLAGTIAVPLCLLRVAPAAETRGPWPAGLPTAFSCAVAAESASVPEIATILAEQDALLVVMLRPSHPAPLFGWRTMPVWALLQAVRPPLLLVPGGVAAQVLPLHIALVTDGDPFTLVHGQRAMHALLLTLPIRITVFHAPVPRSDSSLADALQTVLACGLAARYLTATTTLAVPAPGAVTGILAGARQMRADLLVLIIRQASMEEAGFMAGPMAALLQQSSVPVLLLLAADKVTVSPAS